MNKLFLFIISIVFSISINASHVPGGNITYTCISSNEFEITLTYLKIAVQPLSHQHQSL